MADSKLWHTAAIIIPAVAIAAFSSNAAAEKTDIGNGFMHHGVATPISNHRGTVATVDGDGVPIALVWLFDHRGGYAILAIDARTGAAKEYPTPFDMGGDTPYSSILSTRNRYYTHFNNHFAEFDPVLRAFTFVSETAPQMAMSMTEDSSGVIWSASYPQSGVVSYDPATKTFRDYGQVYKQNWLQYPRSIAVDDKGWVYFGIGSTEAQIIILNRETGEATPVIPDGQRLHGSGQVFPDNNGKVYGSEPGGKWYELYEGRATLLNEPPSVNEKPIITGSQALFHREFPNGERLETVDLVERKITVSNPSTGESRTMPFEYTSEGAHLMGIETAPGGIIAGGTSFPMRFFSYDPNKDEWTNREAFGQWNTVTSTSDRYFVGGYGGGFLLEWNPAQPWETTVQTNPASNPRWLAESEPDINRPHALLAYPGERYVILAGTPGYGLTGGGLMFWDRQTSAAQIIPHTDLIEWHSTMCMLPLPGNKLLGGTTIDPGTGGEIKADVARLYILDMDTRKIEWQEQLFDDVRRYMDLVTGPDGRVFGFADQKLFFVFDPASRKIISSMDTTDAFGATNSQQGPRIFIKSHDGRIFILFTKGIAQLNTDTAEITMLAESPVPIGPGGTCLDGRIYFASGSHVYSWAIPPKP